MKVLFAGSTGMIGNLILNHCLSSNKIDKVITIVRKPSKLQHPKLSEVIIEDFEDYSNHIETFQGIDSAYFCLGVYTGQVPDEVFKKITVTYAVSFAEKLAKESPGAKLCLLSGAGADRTEKSRTPFARYKGMAENQIAKLNLTFYSFRPGYIFPVEPRKEPNLMYVLMRIMYPLVKLLGNKYSITSTALAKAMFVVGVHGASKQILENQDIIAYNKEI